MRKAKKGTNTKKKAREVKKPAIPTNSKDNQRSTSVDAKNKKKPSAAKKPTISKDLNDSQRSSSIDEINISVPSKSKGKSSSDRRSDSNGSCLDCIPGLKGDTERQGFVRKVYALLFINIAITTIFIAIAVVWEPYRNFMKVNYWLPLTCGILASVISFALFLFWENFRKVPYNYILLFTFTLLESIAVSVIACYYSPLDILAVGALTLAMTVGLMIYACFTQTDYTNWLCAMMWISATVLIVFIIFISIYPNSYVCYIVTLILVVAVSIEIIIDTQLLLNRKEYNINLDDYVIAVLLLYLDIIILLLRLLRFFARTRG